jgi:hypothetical protein
MISFRGIIHGKTIELMDAPDLADGQEVDVVVRPATVRVVPAEAERQDEDKVAEWWTPEDDKILEEIARYRRSSGLRELPE